MKDTFYFYLIISLLTHFFVTLILILIHSNFSFFSKPTVIQSSVRIDTIGLPELEKIKSQRKKVAKKKKSVNLHKKKLAKKPKTRSKKNQKKEKKLSDKNKNMKKSGNKLSQGVEGGLSEKEQIEAVNIYLTLVIGKIKLNWNLPKYLSDENYFTQLEVKINDKGQVTYKKIVASSNHDTFDGRVLKAIESSAPFPPPPKSVKKLISDGIVFGLSSQD